MPNKKTRIIVDTNLWISFLLMKTFPELDKRLAGNEVTILFSEELIEEFIEGANRPTFRKYFSLHDLQELLIQMREHGEFIIVTTTTNICRDPKDNFLLALAKDGKATHLITGDKDLLDIKKFEKDANPYVKNIPYWLLTALQPTYRA